MSGKVLSLGHLPLPNTDLPLHERLADAIETAILRGNVKPGQRLPTHREISRSFDVAIGTVTKAIDSLSRRGIVRGEIGRGTFVQDTKPSRETRIIDLSVNGPPQVVKPEIMVAAAERAARSVAGLPNGGYASLTGPADQRATLAAWLGRTRLEGVTPDDLILCVGAQQGISLCLADLAELSPAVATEGATFNGVMSAAASLGMTVLPVRYDDDGMVPDDLDRVLGQGLCKIVYTTPVCQNPLGFETSLQRRRNILAVCRKHEAFIVEDDIYGFYGAKGAPTYKALAPDTVYYVTSLSKILSPVLRAGMVVPPGDRRRRVAMRLRAEVWGASSLALGTGCALIEMGADVSAAAFLKAEATERLKLAASIIDLPPLPMPEGAPHVWLPMPMLEAEKLARRAAEHGVRLTPPDSMVVEGSEAGGIRLCVLAPLGRTDLERALRTLAGLIANPEETVI
ncbi:PLP-dependent aminotransferase family protein [Microvirga pakistanensis]|uniref:aminotransferase-like domain-containing protein n=1 Tax=Microvirga pakistanensis TaxID=1682650 RepID=UPI0010697AE1|nr:PLP-dependent aminotransferase family protein [Microvirga pakistanensis]